MAVVRKAAPARMNTIMHEVRVAPISPSRKLASVSPPVTAESTSAPATPMAAASVGVAIPA
ncbi:hypothetical protein KBTX_04081 [wastewater metagenome]|uniref:Uncharacterized protein n=2 Tax=unclassified sequences TaxID=12908 RepID=A0A5B8RFT3_9ZZZZ|nr:hypothetical protein KBTEX_04081 [uncultured organism]